MTKTNFQNLNRNSAEYVVLHAKWRAQRGKRTPTLPFLFEKNPLKALKLAQQFAYFPLNGEYLKDESLDNYICSKCGASKVKLWRPYQSSNVELLCANCAGENQKKDVSKIDERGLIDSEMAGKTDQIGWYIPAVPTENGTYWGYTSVPGPAADWWKKLPTLTVKVKQLQPSM